VKIAFLNKYQNKVARGAETFVSELATRLSQNNQVDVLTSVRKLFQKKYDVIIPTNGRLQSILVRKISWFTGAKMVISGQSGIGFDDRLNLYTFPDLFIGLTSFQSNWARKINPFLRVETIPNGADLSVYKELSAKVRTRTVLSVGAFTKEKRHDLTIKAVSNLRDANLVIVGGGGKLKDEIKDLGIKLLGGKRFEILSVSHDKMPDMYKKANVLAFPTVPWESFGIAMVEAMASGLPVVATNDPIRREIVGDAGLFVDPANTNEYASALEKALNTDWGNKQSLAKSGFCKPRKQSERFNWDKIAEQYENLFKQILK
jgi:glycosyltransferase involved in cell wall biosynthesis